LFTD
jgi:hypothetical protein